ncbi:MAG: DNA-binding response regulator [Acidobacteria bacterium]|nr:MAG: DNA-binding response regulator [Acidobacteriota bacterium]
MVDLWIMTFSAARREWLSKAVSSEPEIRIAGTAATFPFLRSLMLESSADISLIDLQPEIPSSTTNDWLDELLELTSIVVLSPEPDPVTFNRIRRAGVGSVLQSSASPEQIVHAIRGVASGLMVFDSALAPQPSEDELLEQLTPREGEVLRLLADGLGNKDIAVKLGISEHTIKFHIHSLLGKLGAASRTEAVTRGLRSGLIEL